MSKFRFTEEEKLKIVFEYFEKNESYMELSRKYKTHEKEIRLWIKKYKIHGIEGLKVREKNTRYTKEFKLQCVEEVISGKSSIFETTAKYNISNTGSLRTWIKQYNNNRELKDYEPEPEVYMATAKRKTTKEERLEIVTYCIEHENDYKKTAKKYDVSYSQVYHWVRNYKTNGEEGLNDNRGRRKKDEEVSELERLRRENIRLKRQLKEQEMTVELLKKVKEFERM